MMGPAVRRSIKSMGRQVAAPSERELLLGIEWRGVSNGDIQIAVGAR